MPSKLESVIFVVAFSFGQLENDGKSISVASVSIKFVCPAVSVWVFEMALLTVTIEGTREGKVPPVRLERLADDVIACEVVTLPVSGCLLESLLYGGVIAGHDSLSLDVATGRLVICSRTI